jgi:hypothetical protein
MNIVRIGNAFSAYYSQDGINWIAISGGTEIIDMPITLFAGLAMTSHSTLQEGTATFDSVYIGS